MGCELLMNNIIVSIRLVWSEDLGSVNLRHELYLYLYAECDLLMILLLRILIDVRWCCHWWLCWYELMLLLKIMLIWYDDVVVVDNVIEMIWGNVDADNDIEMRCWWCWKCHYNDVCCVRTWRGLVTLLDIPGGGNRVVKEF